MTIEIRQEGQEEIISGTVHEISEYLKSIGFHDPRSLEGLAIVDSIVQEEFKGKDIFKR